MAAAQGTYDPSGGYYGNGSDNRNDDRRYGNFDQRRLRESVKRLDNLSGDFQQHLDRALDRSRFDHRNREDRINDVAKDFSSATDRLRDRFDNGRNLNRSSSEARRVLQLGSQLDKFMQRVRLNGPVTTDWARIRQDLQVVASAYGFNFNDFDNRDHRYDDNRDNRRRGNNHRFNLSW
jgi:hypothetical protein